MYYIKRSLCRGPSSFDVQSVAMRDGVRRILRYVSLRSKIKACQRGIPTGNYCRIIPHSNMQGSSAVLTQPAAF